MTPHHDKDLKWVTWPTLILLICFMGMAILSMGCATSERVRTGYVKGSSNEAMWVSLGHPNPTGRKRVVKVPIELYRYPLREGMLVRFVRPNGESIAHILKHRVPAWYIQGASNEEGEHVPLAWITDIILPLDENGEPIQDFKWEWDE